MWWPTLQVQFLAQKVDDGTLLEREGRFSDPGES